MDTIAALEATFAHGEKVIAGIRPDQLGASTPCAEWDVAALLDHTTLVVAGMGAAARGTAPSAPEPSNDRAAQFGAIAASTLQAWRTPGVLGQTLDAGAGPMPGEVYAGINLLDTATHVWDLAKATGQPTALPEGIAEAALATAQMIISPEVRTGRFGPEVSVDANASPTDRLVAFLGRQP